MTKNFSVHHADDLPGHQQHPGQFTVVFLLSLFTQEADTQQVDFT